MSNNEIGIAAVALTVLLVTSHLLGYVFERLRQPRLVGEILAGALLGPFALGRLAPELWASLFGSGARTNPIGAALEFIYWVGLLLLMFLSGSETRRLMAKENQRETAWLFGVGTLTPFFLVIAIGPWLPLDMLTGRAGGRTATLLIVAIACAVTSVPVISRILLDLRIMHTRFASLVLGFAVLEDIVLWGVLAVATGTMPEHGAAQTITRHLTLTFIYVGMGLGIAPTLLKELHAARWNILLRASPVGYLFVLLFLYTAAATVMDVNPVFAAFLAGFGVVGGIKGGERPRFASQLEAIAKVSAGVFIPIYFAIVGYKLALGRNFSLPMLAVFLVASSVIAMVSFSVAARLAGFRGLDVWNLAVTKNARGGPGIVLASVAYEAGIINAAFYTTLVLTAVLTSQAAGAYLRLALSKGWPLLSGNAAETANWQAEEDAMAAAER